MSNATIEMSNATTASPEVKSRKPRRWWQFKLRTLFLLLAVAAILVSIGINYVRRAEAQKDFVAWVRTGDRSWMHFQEEAIEYHRPNEPLNFVTQWCLDHLGPDYVWPIKSVKRSFKDVNAVDLDRFNGCPKLELLTLWYPEVSDWAPLEQFSSLKELHVYFSQLEHVKNIGRCHSLKNLTLESSDCLCDISGIEGLDDLERLTISAPQLENIEVLSNLPKLSTLCIRGGTERIKNYKPLLNCTELNDVLLWFTNIDDLKYFANSPKMKTLRIGGDSLKSVAAIEHLKQLEYLQLNYSEISDFSALVHCRKLRKLDLHRCPITDLTALQECREIEELNLSNTNILDLNPIRNLSELKTLEIDFTKVKDLTPLSHCVNLRALSLTNTKVSDLSPLIHCQDLIELDVRFCPVSDLEPLKSLPALKTLKLSDELFAKYSANELTQMFPNCKISLPAAIPNSRARVFERDIDNN